jgi:DNA-binding FadR family transcriptional regulator
VARPSDDEILGIDTSRNASKNVTRDGAASDATGFADELGDRSASASGDEASSDEPADGGGQTANAVKDVEEYREIFATPSEARQARERAAEVSRLDTLFFSKNPEDHAELARAVAAMDREAFASLARSMAELAGRPADRGEKDDRPDLSDAAPNARVETDPAQAKADAGAAQRDFLQGANAAAVQSVVEEIETQVAKLLPDGIGKASRNRLVGEIYRELDTALRGNRVLTQQLLQSARSGRFDAEHQRAFVGLITARAKQSLPTVAKRVMNEWTGTVVTLNEERRARQRNAERRVDIAGTGGGATGQRRATTSKDIDYGRMSDADILNL